MVTLVRMGEKLNSTDINEYLLGAPEDVVNLPTSKHSGANGERPCFPSSTAYTPDLAHIYMLGADDVWHEV